MSSGSIHPYWLPLGESFLAAADPHIAAGASAYMKNKSVFFGIPSPKRRKLLSQFIVQHGLPDKTEVHGIVMSAWKQPEREFQYAAMETLYKIKKQLNGSHISLFSEMITTKSWWDTVDYISPNLLGEVIARFSELKAPTINEFMASNNIWLQRACLLFQLRYREKTDENLLFDLARTLSGEKEFFIRKAIGWALRQYAKTNPESVGMFVSSTQLSGLSRREALKHIGDKTFRAD
ncbi:MAG: DNA alkylation repair protein [Bacteroidetes bacterium]|nr:DNA alkylation repair protein [Bacteroidota bacterium]